MEKTKPGTEFSDWISILVLAYLPRKKIQRMKKLILFNLIIFFVLTGCHSDSAENATPEVVTEDTVHDKVFDPAGDSAAIVKNSPDIWTADFEAATNTFKIHKPASTRLDTLSGDKLVALINNNWDSIHLNFIKYSHDTVYVSIPNSETLTQRLGSTGAENYIATTTFSLTEMKGIKYVNYDFKMGDHASPGVYSRSDFKNFK